MSAHIRQLYYQCQDESQSTESCYQNFAELIIHECLTLVDKIRDECDIDDESQQALGATWAGMAIAQHFHQSILMKSKPKPKWQTLDDDDIYTVCINLQHMCYNNPTTDRRFILARAIESKLKEKNNG